MSGEGAYAVRSPIYPTRTPSIGPFRADELIRPGTVALRVQALNHRLKAHHFRPSPLLRSSRSQILERITGQSHHGGSAPDLPLRLHSTAEPGAEPDHHLYHPLADLGTRSRFGTRQGGGWAPPAGRRTSLRESTAPGAEWARSLRAAESKIALFSDAHEAPSVSPRLDGRPGNDVARDVLDDRTAVPGHNIQRSNARSSAAHRPRARPSERHHTDKTVAMPAHHASAAAQIGTSSCSLPGMEYVLTKPAPRPTVASYASAPVIPDVDPRYTMPVESWDLRSPVSNREAMQQMRMPAQHPVGRHTDLTPDSNPWNRTATCHGASGRPNPAVAEFMHTEPPVRMHSTLGKSRRGSNKISDGPLVWSPDTYYSGYPFTADSEPFPPSVRHEVSLKSLDSDGLAQARPFSFSSDFERLETQDKSDGSRRSRQDGRKKSVSQVSLEAILRRGESKEALSSSRWSRAMTKTSSGIFSLIPRFFNRHEHPARHEIEEASAERSSPSSRAEQVKHVEREQASPAPSGVVELDSTPTTIRPPSPAYMHGSQASGYSPRHRVGWVEEKIPVEARMRPRGDDRGDDQPHRHDPATVDMRALELTVEECMLAYQGLSTGSIPQAARARRADAPPPVQSSGADVSQPSTHRPSLESAISPRHRHPSATPSRLSERTSTATRSVAHNRHAHDDGGRGSKLKRVQVVVNMDEMLTDVNLTVVINGQGRPRVSSAGTQTPRSRA